MSTAYSGDNYVMCVRPNWARYETNSDGNFIHHLILITSILTSSTRRYSRSSVLVLVQSYDTLVHKRPDISLSPVELPR